MPPSNRIDDTKLREIKDSFTTTTATGSTVTTKVRAWQIRDVLEKQYNVKMDESTIRGRFITMGIPLSGLARMNPTTPKEEKKEIPVETTAKIEVKTKTYTVEPTLQQFIPRDEDFSNYVFRDIDKRLVLHMMASKPGSWKYPIAQGKQGTGKTYSYMYFAWINKLPFFLYSMFEDFKLPKLFGDKTIINGSIVFQESLFVKAIQSPSVILFDEINALSNAGTFDFHAMLQNRELFIKDANDGQGKVYHLHNDCKIGFAQNPKSAKYIGGNIKASNFLGRCTYLTFPEFSKNEIRIALKKKFPTLVKADLEKFVAFYFACVQTIEKSGLPVDISIRQLNNVIDLWFHGMDIKFAIEDGLTSILESVSQPKAKDTFFRLAQMVWKELIDKKEKT